MGSKVSTDLTGKGYVNIPKDEKNDKKVDTTDLRNSKETTTSTNDLIDCKESSDDIENDEIFFDIEKDNAKTSERGM